MSAMTTLLGPIGLCALAALCAVPAVRLLGAAKAGLLLAVGPAIGFVLLAMAIPEVVAGGIPKWSMDWVPGLDLTVALRLDAWSLVVALVVTGVGAPLLIYAGGYGADDPRAGRMIAMLAGFAAAMLGLVMSDHLLLLYVCWETTSVLSFLLVGHKHEYADARYAARRALVITVAGGLALLAGIVLMAEAGGSWLFTDLVASGSVAGASTYPWILLCFAFAAATKSAQFPFHVWLPGAMAAPTPVSCYLHAATMVKAGVFLLGAVSPMLSGTALWTTLITGMGTITAVYAGLRLTAQRDAKGLVAWSTVSALGMMVALLGLGTTYAATGLVTVLVAHAAYKATLFMVVGSLDHGTHTRDLGRFGGLFKAMPITAITAMLAAASLAGLPLMMGFVGKEYLLKSVLDGPWWATVGISIAALCGAGGAVALGLLPFIGKAKDPEIHAHESPATMIYPALFLALAGAALGPATAWLGGGLLMAAASAVAAAEVPAAKWWPGTDWVLVLSLCLATGGGLLGLGFAAWRARIRWSWPGGGVIADRLMDTTLVVAKWHTKIVVNGNLRSYVGTLVVFASIALATGMALGDNSWGPPEMPEHPLLIPAMLMMVGGLIGVVTLGERVGAIVAMGAIGCGVSLYFLARGAPDLALTQLLVEALTVLLFVIAFRSLPKLGAKRGGFPGFWNAVIAIAFAVTIGLSMLAVIPGTDSVGEQFHARSLVEGYGRNIVNVILVDFRALDTLGEISVLGLAAIGLLAVLRPHRTRSTPPNGTDSQRRETEL